MFGIGKIKNQVNNFKNRKGIFMTLKEFLEKVDGNESDIIIYASEQEALKAVESDGDALQYVKEQTEAICLKAVESDGDALQYVNKKIFAV